MPKISYPTHTTQEVTVAEFNLVQRMFNFADGNKICAIKFIREQHGLGLREARDLCEAIAKVELLPT